ncbi:hypothetical protein AM501_30790 [Aneurinibacillus migulanus]|uniref:Uncharacterized protein n=1 Tax=Aneurinibacillus migulanus TaxID=47500 RepID=A0A0D1Y010_ANEMI|nr:hypothetical protein [Aneurinibacillus migulanus]KIV50222.1 hypothetical protein TS65_30935 [Aneurinibacillus migulanus]KIV52577.1 hypothetical protein TS64_21255 [Aneurinibacillus migulanus]KON96262.1 hypothetical protein AF333_13025 [Aneurinibacillus migulanus]KPD04617.1 hypothetical protein AM501_30790 [Aneurinibacillus migulanus]MCP1359261.1 hypothetical protein [Aneurinibacillus migulanus]
MRSLDFITIKELIAKNIEDIKKDKELMEQIDENVENKIIGGKNYRRKETARSYYSLVYKNWHR